MSSGNNRSPLKFLQLVLAAAILACTVQAENCFYHNHMTHTYDHYDSTGNFTLVREYFLRLNTVCTLVQDTDNKIDWYSSDISSRYMLFFDYKDGQGCRSDNVWNTYTRNQQFYMGVQPSVNGSPILRRELCLVKYEMTNENKKSDLRMVINNMDPPPPAAARMLAASLAAVASLVAVISL